MVSPACFPPFFRCSKIEIRIHLKRQQSGAVPRRWNARDRFSGEKQRRQIQPGERADRPQDAGEWAVLIEHYLRERKTLQLSFLILDARRGWMDKDLDLKNWLEVNNHPYLVVASKIDKLNQAEQQRGLKAIRQHAEPLPFSAVTGRGVREIWQAITKTHQS